MNRSPELVVLRVVGGVVIDHPFSAAVPVPLWAATFDEDRNEPSGWRRTMWAPAPRGWSPQGLHLGDVIEFGSWADPRWRWCGWHTHHGGEAIIITGPYPGPAEALVDAAVARREVVERALRSYQRERLETATLEPQGHPSPRRDEPPHPAR
jgi:hypothetical protein